MARTWATPGPTFREEESLRAHGYCLVAGIDEAGRGPLAGPVVAAAVILPLDRRFPWLPRVRDSKQLTALEREGLFDLIREGAVAAGVGVESAEVIDSKGIVPATKRAMLAAIKQLAPAPDYLLIDAVKLPGREIPQKAIIKGDTLSFSIAAASIIAKVTRDRVMIEMDSRYPGYGFARHKGYGTPEHLAALQSLGPCPIHRKCFSPVQEVWRE